MDIIGGFLDNEDFKSYVLRLVQSFYDENNESFKQCYKNKESTKKNKKLENIEPTSINKPEKYEDIQYYFKDFINIILKCTNDKKNELIDNLKKLIDEIFDNMYKYLYIYDPEKYINEHFKPENNYKILNEENYTIRTVNIKGNIYEYFKLFNNGKIDKYNIIKPIDDLPLNQLYPKYNINTNISNYELVYDYQSYFEEIVRNYCTISKVSKDFGGIIMENFIDKLFYLGDNNELLINKSNNNIIFQLVQTGDFYKLITINNYINMKYGSKYNTDRDYIIHMTELNFIKNEYVFISNKQYIEIYGNFLIDSSTKNYLEKLKNIFMKKQIDHKYISILFSYLDALDFIIAESKIINEKICHIYNKSLFENIFKQYKRYKNDIILKKIPNMFKFVDTNYDKIQDLIKVELILLFLPIIIDRYVSPQINYLFHFYLINLLETYDNNISKIYILNNLFGLNNKNDYKTIFKTTYNVIKQCQVDYTYNNKQIKHPTCGESTLLNILVYIFLNNSVSIDFNKLNKLLNNKSAIQMKIILFFEKYPSVIKLLESSACKEFAQLVSNIPNIEYNSVINDYHYDLIPTFDNIMKLLFYILEDRIYENVNYHKKLSELINDIKISHESSKTILTIANNINCTFSNQHAQVQSTGEEKVTININDYNLNKYLSNNIITLYFRKYSEYMKDKLNISINDIENKLFKLIKLFNYDLINIREFFNIFSNKLNSNILISLVNESTIHDDIKHEIMLALNEKINLSVDHPTYYYINTILFFIFEQNVQNNNINKENLKLLSITNGKLREGNIIFNIYLLFNYLSKNKIEYIYVILKLNNIKKFDEDIRILVYNVLFNKKVVIKEDSIVDTFYILLHYINPHYASKLYKLYDSNIKLDSEMKNIIYDRIKFYIFDIFTYPRLEDVIKIALDKTNVIILYDQILTYLQSPDLSLFKKKYANIIDIKLDCENIETPSYVENIFTGTANITDLSAATAFVAQETDMEINILIYKELNLNNERHILKYEVSEDQKTMLICYEKFKDTSIKGGYYNKYYKYKLKYLSLKQ